MRSGKFAIDPIRSFCFDLVFGGEEREREKTQKLNFCCDEKHENGLECTIKRKQMIFFQGSSCLTQGKEKYKLDSFSGLETAFQFDKCGEGSLNFIHASPIILSGNCPVRRRELGTVHPQHDSEEVKTPFCTKEHRFKRAYKREGKGEGLFLLLY